MAGRDTSALDNLWGEIESEYALRFPASAVLSAQRGKHLLDETSHSIRWNRPFMPTVRLAEGACIEDLDGHRIVDYWQGHFANILGHNPAPVREAMLRALEAGRGLQSGMIQEVEAHLAELLCARTGCDTVRFTTSGTLGTFYAAVLARAFTGRDVVLKVGGGWHGSQSFGLKGVVARDDAFDRVESEGLESSISEDVVVTRFNDPGALRRVFEADGDRIACFLIEPVLGAAGGMVASREYLKEARRLTERHGALLVCDEIITGFRFRAGDVTSLYGIRPDLLVLGKIVGGGMPVAALAGRADVLALCSRASGRVKFEGGTYSSHELSLIAASTMVEYLVAHEDEVYSRVARAGDRARRGLARAAEDSGFACRFAATPGEVIPGSSLVLLHAVRDGAGELVSPEDLVAWGHPTIGNAVLKSVLMLHDVSTRNGLGALSTAHTDQDIDDSVEAFRAALQRLKTAGLY